MGVNDFSGGWDIRDFVLGGFFFLFSINFLDWFWCFLNILVFFYFIVLL